MRESKPRALRELPCWTSVRRTDLSYIIYTGALIASPRAHEVARSSAGSRVPVTLGLAGRAPLRVVFKKVVYRADGPVRGETLGEKGHPVVPA